MYIYKVTNCVNQKVYIGQSIRPVEQRIRRHFNDAKNNILDTHFARAIRKYGEEAFTVEVIDSAATQEELTLKEQMWIRRFDATNPECGYNETDAISKCGGNTYCSKTKGEMSSISEKIRMTKMGGQNPNATKVKCKNIKTGQELFFDTVNDCRCFFNEKTHRFITTRCSGEVLSLYDDAWAIAYMGNDYLYKTKVNKSGKHVLAENIETHEAIRFESVRLMCRELRLPRDKVQKKLKNGGTCPVIIDSYTISVID